MKIKGSKEDAVIMEAFKFRAVLQHIELDAIHVEHDLKRRTHHVELLALSVVDLVQMGDLVALRPPPIEEHGDQAVAGQQYACQNKHFFNHVSPPTI